MTPLSTFVARVSDSMLLVATMDSGQEGGRGQRGEEECREASKKVLKSLKSHSPSRCSIFVDPLHSSLHYVMEGGVVYLTVADRDYPKKLAFAYLIEVQREFEKNYSADQIARFSRPYEAIAFEPRLNKLRREFIDPRSPTNLTKLNSDLADIHSIMSANINDVLQRGEKLDVIESRSDALVHQSQQFKKMSRYINLQTMLKMYAPVAGVLLFVVLILYFRFRWF